MRTEIYELAFYQSCYTSNKYDWDFHWKLHGKDREDYINGWTDGDTVKSKDISYSSYIRNATN